jgi:hypothetical protein
MIDDFFRLLFEAAITIFDWKQTKKEKGFLTTETEETEETTKSKKGKGDGNE